MFSTPKRGVHGWSEPDTFLSFNQHRSCELNMKCGVSPKPKRGGSPIKVNQDHVSLHEIQYLPHTEKGRFHQPKRNLIIPRSLKWNPLASSYAFKIVQRVWDFLETLIHLGGASSHEGYMFLHKLITSLSVLCSNYFFFFITFRVNTNIMEALFYLWG